MTIDFTGAYAPNENFGINFQAKVNEENVPCVISTEALDYIDPSTRFGDASEKFLNNRSRFESIARNKILNGEMTNGKVFICQSDVL
jgi:hypothetical protein